MRFVDGYDQEEILITMRLNECSSTISNPVSMGEILGDPVCFYIVSIVHETGNRPGMIIG